MTVLIRPATPADAEGILAVVRAAFSDATRDADEELDIVRRTWSARPGAAVIELVADHAGTVVGHLQAAPGTLDGSASSVAGVAPVCVGPAYQGHGNGRALMDALVRAATGRGWPLLVLLGDPAFYARFGFEPAGPLGVSYTPVGAGNPHFQARRLPGYTKALRGEFGYCWE